MEKLDGTEFYDILDECDWAFYEYEENLAELTRDYVMAHRDEFQ